MNRKIGLLVENMSLESGKRITTLLVRLSYLFKEARLLARPPDSDTIDFPDLELFKVSDPTIGPPVV